MSTAQNMVSTTGHRKDAND